MAPTSTMKDSPPARDPASGSAVRTDEAIERDFELSDLVHLEEMFQEEGREEGIAEGLRAGRPEGFTLGLEKGHEMLTEVAYYQSCAETWLAHVQRTSIASPESNEFGDDDDEAARPSRSRSFPPRSRTTLEVFLTLTRSFPRHNALDTGLIELLDRIRGRWKLVCAVLGVPLAAAAYAHGAAFTPVRSRSTDAAVAVEKPLSQSLAF
ncbi:hypothetical protein AMAG_00318 [Allomyces macrogynus ATCC 38327]|uniref:Essential protein Yae1 N-terminal domain-containing protein n=1 Tax=Allomyces macrogynus (strain ATCC 38327) TaxID=578462 RepID=A0A0L0RVJ8_ALLM3|nr:hypothetical protein AMAG_00318 [Allomyces macrogynus ATCC 38327]|eukprot:KNE54338.1 hypothetical protein AMAG_00318 [Allomyces macrogynus ATCC 38327]